ncbi:hypothetical protein NQ314_001559 [Rhamnusium bicolor]|uniref:DDE Tnp4 domain-containing protein n=1 Tax=Rhamnusium bicolor TaxID=1586634 RepID=A0AAV8ZV18_9CUCU|nr:hypothetical protein NQ314_001559 [Rhamnusium bicolor]
MKYLATGNSFRLQAFNYRLDKRSVREKVYSCCDAIWRKLQPIVMPIPDEAMWLKIEHDFYTKWNFPNLGAIDGKHVLIQAPPHRGTQSSITCFSSCLLQVYSYRFRRIW